MAIDSGDLVGGGGGVSLSMPMFIISQGSLFLKSEIGIKVQSDEAAFYTALQDINTNLGWEATTLVNTTATTEQTIVDLTSQSGVLTNVIAPTNSAADVIIRVTVDGEVVTFSFTNITSASFKAIIGDLIHRNPDITTSNGAGYGGGLDPGWHGSFNQQALLLNPSQVIERGQHGMPFKDSLKVTVQSANFVVGSATHKAVVTWALDTPSGLA